MGADRSRRLTEIESRIKNRLKGVCSRPNGLGMVRRRRIWQLCQMVTIVAARSGNYP
jgi:hypothetical protein